MDSISAAPLPTRPRPKKQHSASVPSTPRQHPHDFYDDRTPSPGGPGNQSPRSISSDLTQQLASLRSGPTTLSTCKFQSTKTARRRMPYDSSDPLPFQKPSPKDTLSPDEEKRLDEEIRALFEESLPSGESQQRRETEADKVRNILRSEFHNKEIHVSVFGSSGNLLNTESSDVDICVTMKDLSYICTLAEILSKNGMKNVTCVHAKGVPIVKLWDSELKMSCDLNVNNRLALINTRLVKAYMEIDERARILAMAVKFWSRRRVLNEASGGGLSSYTWTLMVINFLQTRTPPVLPVIELKDVNGSPKPDFQADAEQFKGFGAANRQSAGSLVFHFFRQLAHELDYESSVISVRAGRLLTKAEKHWDKLVSQRLCCEEPFNVQRNLGNTADEFSFHGIHLELRQSFDRIVQGCGFRNDVCEQFKFPEHEPKPLFERPAPQPKPTLTRSASQSGRGGRYGNQRGSRNRNDQRNGNGNRRASSASVFAPEPSPFMLTPQIVGQPAFFPHGVQFPPNMSIERQQQHLSAEIDNLMRREQQLAWFNQNASRLSALDLERTPSNAAAAAASSSPTKAATEDGRHEQPSWTTNNAAQFQSGSLTTLPPFNSPTMSHSTSHQGTSTNPSSPMLMNAIPLRRNLQRSPGSESPGASHRSQSQPARSYFAYGSLPQGYMMMPQGYRNRQGQQTMSMLRPGSVFVPYGYAPVYPGVPMMSMHNINADAQPREYVGYGVASRTPTMSPMSQDLRQIPTYEDLHRQGRTLAPSKLSPMPPGMGSRNGSVHQQSRSTSPLPIKSEIPRDVAFMENKSPMIVNGSYSSPNLNTLGNKPFRRMSDMPDLSRPYGGVGSHMISDLRRQEALISSDRSSDAVLAYSPNTPSPRLEPERTSRDKTPNGLGLSTGTQRVNMSHLDLGAPAERGILSSALSPVHEQTSPMLKAPTTAAIANGSNGTYASSAAANVAPSVVTSAGPNVALNAAMTTASSPMTNDTSGLANTVKRRSMPPLGTQSNEWQQAGRKGNKKKPTSSQKTGGQPMPANVAERKGG